MIIEIKNGMARCRCNIRDCENQFELEVPTGDTAFDKISRGVAESLNCERCVAIADKVEADYRRRMRRHEIGEILERAGVPERFREIREPYNRPLSEWIWRHKNKNLLIGGDTGRGKTGAICNALAHLALNCETVRYVTCRELVSGYSRAKAGAEGGANKYLQDLYRCDVLAVDELIGKTKVIETGAECMFEVIDRAYSYNIPRIWIAGQFYAGSLRKLFGDDESTVEAVERRLEETFTATLGDDDLTTKGTR